MHHLAYPRVPIDSEGTGCFRLRAAIYAVKTGNSVLNLCNGVAESVGPGIGKSPRIRKREIGSQRAREN